MQPPARTAADVVRSSPALFPGILLVLLFALWSHRDGGYAVVDWAPGALFVLVLVLVFAFSAPARYGGGRSVSLAISCLAAFTGWSYLSIAWADVPADAWTGANRTLLYLCVFVLVVIRPWRPTGAAIVLAVYTLAIWAVVMFAFLRVVDHEDPSASFAEGRLSDPISYANGMCALLVTALLPALYFASRREVPVLARGLFIAIAGTLAELVLLTQSRASLIAVPIALVVYLVLVPGRIRSVVTLLPIGLVVALGAASLLEVYEAVLSENGVGSALDVARTTLVRSWIGLFLAGAALGLIDRRLHVSGSLKVALGRGLAGVALVVVTVAGLVGALSIADPVDRASGAWDSFRSGAYVTDPATPHLASGFGSGRYKLWKVAVDEFRASPILGVGVDNYAVDYLRERTDQSQPLYPHSVFLRALSQTGIVGTGFFLGFLISAFAAVWPRVRNGTNFARGVVGVAMTVFLYWLLHGAIDWFWEIPALAAPAIAFLGIAMRTEEESTDPADSHRPTRSIAVRLGVTLLAFVAGASLALPWLAEREANAAISGWRSNPAAAYRHLDRASTLNRLSDEPAVIESVIAASLGDEQRQRTALLRALERNPLNWYPMVELAALASVRLDRAGALAWLERAERLNPREPTIAFVRQQVLQGRPVTSASLQAMYVDQASLLTRSRQRW